jgi:hypothetical protein
MKKFIYEENLFIEIDENERKKLQNVFEEVCRGYNKSRYILILLNGGQDSRYRSKISLFFFFVVIQHSNPYFNLIKKFAFSITTAKYGVTFRSKLNIFSPIYLVL